MFEHAYRYARPSSLRTGATPRLTLETSGPDSDPNPHFFEGRLRQPRLVAELLTAVHLIVGARFFTPANSVERAIALADPVVTSGGGLLRFEGFSSCCSAYIRVDLLPDAYEGDVVGKGTTNVDFNAPMRAALASVRDETGLSLSVGCDVVTLRSGGIDVTERKVPLPTRWLRGMVEVQSYQAGMRLRLQAKPIEALRFLRTLPRTSTSRTPLWISRVASGLASSTRPSSSGVRITEVARLKVLQVLLPRATSLSVFADDAHQASTWVLDFGSARLSLVLSSEVWRGFSGEGQALLSLICAGEGDARTLAHVRAALNWQAAIEANELAARLGVDSGAVDDALRTLGASGLVGFDVSLGRFFHRVLPFDLTKIEDLHPRLASARELLATSAVQVLADRPFTATVNSGGVQHRVLEKNDELHCTCPWHAKHHGERGPCKHVLAASVLRASNH